MEVWTIGNKTIMLLFVVTSAYFAAAASNQRLVLLFLIYVALNLGLHIAKKSVTKQAVILVIMMYLIGCAVYHPYFVLLLPFSMNELASFYPRKNGYLLIAVFLPLLFLHGDIMILYAFAAALSFFGYVMVRHYMGRVVKQEDELERMRKDLQKMAKRLNENREFARASEYMVKLEERNRLAQEIHDGIGHAMTGALIQMEAAKRLLGSDTAAAETLLQNAIGISKEAIEEIRITLKHHKPPVEQLGLSRLKTVVEAFAGQTGLMTSVVHEGNIERITPLHWKIIYENVTEALTNCAKYSGASAVHVEIRVLNRFIKAVVADNGKGASKIVKGLGLIGMEERTASVSGTVVADGTRGFIITTLIPYGS
ncbi:sensor histidine kinase [Paenibacillus donghaensis]|jgi:signal transduction histidine kinase|uniref:sensor histidine kinase n=1 Tax=Paenibacillus donghaensis TaxID=414771 RepID=UPI0018838244|nr:sensor histidine kinase [Paenibacillus donghaensis]MBE9915863.1 sensor histidine kinase [Paenibacillus donghaensis]